MIITLHSCFNNSNNIEEWDGYYFNDFEINSFLPCGLGSEDESWWITGENEPLEEFLSNYYEIKDEGCEVYVRIRGTKTKKGSYGNKGEADREFRITETLDVRCRQEDDCDCSCKEKAIPKRRDLE
jgi:hypothetical protein